MPELPEVETTRRGIAPHIQGKRITAVIVRQPRLRWPVAGDLAKTLVGQRVTAVDRRAKYLLVHTPRGSLIMHLGMSGSLRVLPADSPVAKHDHLDLVFDDQCLRLHDPRRFGAVLWCKDAIEQHPLLRHLGPEPLSHDFDGDWLYRLSRKRRVAVKNLIMDAGVVVGVGNIYANEALFLSGIHPQRPCNRISAARYNRLAANIKAVLQAAIRQGGSTLRDFLRVDGKPGYFAQRLQVYGRAGQPCSVCGQPIRQRRIGQRSSFYCSHCQR